MSHCLRCKLIFIEDYSINPSKFPYYMLKSFCCTSFLDMRLIWYFQKASWWASDDNTRDSIEIYTNNLFNCSTIDYSLHLRVLINSTVSSSLALLFFCGSSTNISFDFLFRSLVLAKSSDLYIVPVRDTY